MTHSGLHCGKVFAIPGHHRQGMPYYSRPPSCDARTEEIAGVPIETFGEWNYWTEHGQWVLFAGDVTGVSRGDHGQPINIYPYFQNWGPHLWKVRVFFDCKKRY